MPQLLSPRATTTEAHAPRARAPQQKKPPQREAHAPQRRTNETTTKNPFGKRVTKFKNKYK